MSLQDDIKPILKHVNIFESTRLHNATLFEIFEGDLMTHVLFDLQRQLSPNSFQIIRDRVAPINVLIRMIDKLSKIYVNPPKRVINGTDNDKKLYDFYFKHMRPNVTFNCGNEFFNLFKNTFIEPLLEKGKPKIRIIPSSQFMVFSSDIINPLRVTHLVKFMGTGEMKVGNKGEVIQVGILFLYTDEEFLIINTEGAILRDEMARLKQDGKNPFGTIPGVYVNRSKNKLIPLIDTDTLQMTKLFPVLISDLNFGAMFQAFSIIYGIDLNDENLRYSPNAFWRFKSDKTGSGDSKPQIGTLKPELDITGVLELIRFQLGFWLQSRNIKPGDVAQITTQNFASGISKMVDEMDTSEDRQKQVPFFEDAEEEFWFKIANNFHPHWARNKTVDLTTAFSSNVEVDVQFQEQRPNIKRKEVIEEQAREVKEAFTTRKRAIERLNPDMLEEEIVELMAEIEADRTVTIEDDDGSKVGQE